MRRVEVAGIGNVRLIEADVPVAGGVRTVVYGQFIDPTTVLVLAPMGPKTTARLERVRIYPPGS